MEYGDTKYYLLSDTGKHRGESACLKVFYNVIKGKYVKIANSHLVSKAGYAA